MKNRENDPEQGLSEEARHDRQLAEREVAERRRAQTSPDPHHELNNPVTDPDPTEFPDPYEKRPDPRDPESGDDPAPADSSTSEPPPPRNRERLRDGEGTEQ